MRVTPIGADLSQGRTSDLKAFGFKPGPLFALAMNALAFSGEHIALQGRLAILLTLARPCSTQHGAGLFTTKMRYSPATHNAFLSLRVCVMLLLRRTHIWDIPVGGREHLKQLFPHPLGFLLLERPHNEDQL